MRKNELNTVTISLSEYLELLKQAEERIQELNANIKDMEEGLKKNSIWNIFRNIGTTKRIKN